jgi:hypothetical protein
MPRLRIACWNCADGLARKQALLARITADLVVVSEVRQADFAAIAPLYTTAVYTPTTTARGIASFSTLPGLIQQPYRAPQGAECYQRLRLGPIDILAAWVKPQGSYTAPAGRTLAHFLRSQPRKDPCPHRIILGDLNLNPGFDRVKATGRATALMALMARRGLRSLYHQHSGEAFGAETRATHYFLRNMARPFHIDFILASAGLALHSFDLGDPADWIGPARGDHLPLMAELDF